jgi:hypothetical protein
MKLGVAELRRFSSYAECARWFLAPRWRDGNLSSADAPWCGAGSALARASRGGGGGGGDGGEDGDGGGGEGGGGGGGSAEGRSCTVANGCCRRHPKMPSCVHAKQARGSRVIAASGAQSGSKSE